MLVKCKANFTAKSVSAQCTDLHTATKLEMSIGILYNVI